MEPTSLPLLVVPLAATSKCRATIHATDITHRCCLWQLPCQHDHPLIDSTSRLAQTRGNSPKNAKKSNAKSRDGEMQNDVISAAVECRMMRNWAGVLRGWAVITAQSAPSEAREPLRCNEYRGPLLHHAKNALMNLARPR